MFHIILLLVNQVVLPLFGDEVVKNGHKNVINVLFIFPLFCKHFNKVFFKTLTDPIWNTKHDEQTP